MKAFRKLIPPEIPEGGLIRISGKEDRDYVQKPKKCDLNKLNCCKKGGRANNNAEKNSNNKKKRKKKRKH